MNSSIKLLPIQAEALFEVAPETHTSVDPQLSKLAETHWAYADDDYHVQCHEWRKPLSGGAKLWLLFICPGNSDSMLYYGSRFGSEMDPIILTEIVSSDNRPQDEMPSYEEVLKDGYNEFTRKAASRAVPLALLTAAAVWLVLWLLLRRVLESYFGMSSADSWFISDTGAVLAFVIMTVVGENRRVNRLPALA
jgi:hypothetical protein